MAWIRIQDKSVQIVIRKMEPSDREAVRRICWDTGHGGDSIATYFDDPELFADFFTAYYTDVEPESSFVAADNGEVIGYLLGCPDTRRYNRIFFSKIILSIIVRMLLGRYKIGRRTRRYIREMVCQFVRGDYKGPPLALYPAHLHINLAAGYRRAGLGHRLMKNYFDYLHARGIRGLHLGTTSMHTTALSFYNGLGFKVFAATKTRFGGKPITSLVYVKTLETR